MKISYFLPINKQKGKWCDYLNRWGRSTWQNSTFIHDLKQNQKPLQTKIKRELSQPHEDHLWKKPCIIVKDLMLPPAGISNFTTPVHLILANAIGNKREIKGIRIGKEDIKLPL